MGVLPASVEDAGDQPVATQAPRIGRAARLAFPNLDLDSFACHGAAV
jgi:hypothetical protein